MQNCLGISISEKMIKYAKVQKDNKTFKILSYGIRFYDSIDLQSTIQQIIDETDSRKVPVSIDITNEKYYYFNLFNMANKEYVKKAVETEFESFCNENHMNRNAFEGRYTYARDLNNQDQNKIIYIYEDKGKINERVNNFKNARISSITPNAVALPNIVRIEKNKNIMIVNLEDKTTISTIINQKIYNVDTLNTGLENAFDKIKTKENSNLKAYEILKNMTIYTMEMQTTSTDSTNSEYLQYVVPDLYKIAQEIQNLTKNYKKIDEIYLTGYGTVINNIDLYFQEYFKESKVEILKPFFIENDTRVNIKDYVEVNSAIAQAIQGLGFGIKTLNFKNGGSFGDLKTLLTSDVKDLNFKSLKGNLSGKKIDISLTGQLEKIEIGLIRDCTAVLLIIIMYCVGSGILVNYIRDKKAETNAVTADTTLQIEKANADDTKILTKTQDYQKYKSNLENTSAAIENKRSRKNQITTLLNKIVYNIPKEVQLTEIKNTEIQSNGETVQHIVISAQAQKYEQLAYFKAKLKNANILNNIVSTEGTKDDEYVRVIIEGDLRTY